MINRNDTFHPYQQSVARLGRTPFQVSPRGYGAKPVYPVHSPARGSLLNRAAHGPAVGKPQAKNTQALQHHMGAIADSQKKIKLNQFIMSERKIVHKDLNLTRGEKGWLNDQLGRLNNMNNASNRSTLLAKEKAALQFHARNNALSPRLRQHIGMIAERIDSQSPTLQFPAQPSPAKQSPAKQSPAQHSPSKYSASARPSISNPQRQNTQQFFQVLNEPRRFMQNPVRPQPAANPYGKSSSYTHGRLNNSPKVPTLNPMARQALASLRNNDISSGMSQVNSMIAKGETAKAVREAIATGFDAASLNNDRFGGQKLSELDKPELQKVMVFAKQRVDVRVAVGKLTPEAGKKTNEEIDSILDKFKNPYNRKTNMKAVMNNLKANITDANNAQDAKNCLAKGLNNAHRIHGKKADLNAVLAEARLAALSMPNGIQIKDILFDFGQESGLPQQQAERLLNKYSEGFAEKGKGLEHLSQRNLGMVIRLAKRNAPQGASGQSVLAALDEFSERAGIRH